MASASESRRIEYFLVVSESQQGVKNNVHHIKRKNTPQVNLTSNSSSITSETLHLDSTNTQNQTSNFEEPIAKTQLNPIYALRFDYLS